MNDNPLTQDEMDRLHIGAAIIKSMATKEIIIVKVASIGAAETALDIIIGLGKWSRRIIQPGSPGISPAPSPIRSYWQISNVKNRGAITWQIQILQS